MDNMRLIQTADMKCDDASIATVATWWGYNYEMAFSQLWDLKFLSEDIAGTNLIGDRIKTPDENSKYINLKKYHNILTTPNECDTSDEFINVIMKEVINCHPLMLNIESINKPWATKLDLSEGKSFILIYSFDKSKNGFNCVDIHGSKRVEFLPMQNFIEESKSRKAFNFACFSRLDQENLQIDWKEFLLGCVNNICKNPNNDYFGSIKMLADSFLNIDMSLECRDSSFDDSPLCTNLRNICRYRNLYALSLEYLSRKFNIDEINSLAKMFKAAGSKWYPSLALLAKSDYKGIINKDIIERIRTSICNAAEYEKNICKEIYNICGSKSLLTAKAAESNSANNKREENFYHLQLDGYFNNKAFNIDGNIADFDGTESCFLKGNLPDGGIITSNKITFNLKHCLLSKEDNISCQSQIINITNFKENVDKIYFLCCAEWGNFYENVKITYTGNDTENLYLTFADWVYKTTSDELTIAWQGNGMFENRKKVGEVFIFEQVFLLNGKKIKSIELPNSPDCHIFAVTFGYNQTAVVRKAKALYMTQ